MTIEEKKYGEWIQNNPFWLKGIADYVKDKFPEIAIVEVHVGDDPDGRNCVARITLDDELSKQSSS